MGKDGVVSTEKQDICLPVLQSDVQNKIVNIRGCKVITDADVAEFMV